jgi:hypothetical protein
MNEFLSIGGLIAVSLILLALTLSVVSAVIWFPGVAAVALVKSTMPVDSGRRGVVIGVRLVAMAIPAMVIGWQVFTAFSPDADFYRGEYKVVTLREAPISAQVETREASYPDLHGNYCSKARFSLAPADYQRVLGELLADQRLQQIGHDESPPRPVRQATDSRADIRWAFSRDLESEPGSHRFIFFGKDGTHVDIQRCEV